MRKRTYLANLVSPWPDGIPNEIIEEKSEHNLCACKYVCPQCRIFLEESEEGIFRCPICGQVAVEDCEGGIFYMKKV